MLDRSRLALNRIIAPSLPLEGFLVPERLEGLQGELRALAAAASELDCPAILLCPENDPADRRPADQALRDTVRALRALEPILAGAGLLGYIEPLGFPESSLRSLISAQRALQESGCRRYRLVYDTFHHHLGPDDSTVIENEYQVGLTGLVHVSGVTREPGREGYRDGHRVLPDGRDRMDSREQVRHLLRLGYGGDISFEPFSPEVQALSPADLARALEAGIEYMVA